MRGELAPERAAGVIHTRAVAVEERIPLRTTFGGSDPQRAMRGIHEELHHVVARSEAQLLERQFERHRPGAPETGADDFECHASPDSSRSRKRREALEARPGLAPGYAVLQTAA